MASIANDQLLLLYEVSRSLHSLIELDELLPAVVEKTKDLLDAEGCSLILLDPVDNELYFPFVSPENTEVAERLRHLRMPADKGIAGAVLQSGESLVVPDVRADPRFYGEVDQQTGGSTRSILCAPLPTQRGMIGVIECINKRGDGGFTGEELPFLEALAASTAIAIENARTVRTLKDAEARLRDEVALLERERPLEHRFQGIVGRCAPMERVFRLMESAIGSPITVLLQGETGVGKEVVARAIHFDGARRDKPFVAVNCGAFPETLLESELFGYRKGAFTGAVTDKRGLFEAADGGTIFLDEIADTPPLTQVKLLRVLERGEFTPLGATDPRRVDTRVISATNRDLSTEVAAGRFREDLYYRLNAFPIHVPPLRERQEDIPVLAGFLLKELVAAWGKHEMSIAPEAMDSLVRYEWPGNVRELRHELERAVTLAGDERVLRREFFSDRVIGTRERGAAIRARGSLREARSAFEKEYVRLVLSRNDGNVSRSAKALGISRVMLQRKMKEYGLRPFFASK